MTATATLFAVFVANRELNLGALILSAAFAGDDLFHPANMALTGRAFYTGDFKLTHYRNILFSDFVLIALLDRASGGRHSVRMGELIGHIAALARFPVKSMGGEALNEVALGWSGIVGDRQWAFVKKPAHSRFPWFTGRDFSKLNAWRAAYPEGDDAKTASPLVTAPDGWSSAIDDPAVLERLRRESEKDMNLLRLGRGAYDSLPLSVVSTAGHAAVEASHGMAIDPRRFRINVVVDSDLPLRVWAGRRLSFGGEDGPQIAVTAPIERCVMITIDPDTGERDPPLMRTIAQQFDNKYGMHANVVRPGILRRGAEVRISD